MSVRLYVGNLPKEPVEREALQKIFAEAGDSITTKVIKDRKSGKCRGFAFVTVPTDEAADQFIEKYNGQSFMDSPLKIEKALPRAKGKAKEEEKAEGNATTATAQPAKSSKKSGKKRGRGSSGSSSSQNESFQPDPRWADALAQLKERLAAQATNS
jgi:RNA recognition motif-containing protein